MICVAAVDPAGFLQRLAEQCEANLPFWIGFAIPQHRYDQAYAVTLLRARHKRPCNCRAAEKHNELTSPHIRTQAQGPALYRLRRVL
jgi:hypothetical protein